METFPMFKTHSQYPSGEYPFVSSTNIVFEESKLWGSSVPSALDKLGFKEADTPEKRKVILDNYLKTNSWEKSFKSHVKIWENKLESLKQGNTETTFDFTTMVPGKLPLFLVSYGDANQPVGLTSDHLHAYSQIASYGVIVAIVSNVDNNALRQKISYTTSRYKSLIERQDPNNVHCTSKDKYYNLGALKLKNPSTNVIYPTQTETNRHQPIGYETSFFDLKFKLQTGGNIESPIFSDTLFVEPYWSHYASKVGNQIMFEQLYVEAKKVFKTYGLLERIDENACGICGSSAGGDNVSSMNRVNKNNGNTTVYKELSDAGTMDPVFLFKFKCFVAEDPSWCDTKLGDPSNEINDADVWSHGSMERISAPCLMRLPSGRTNQSGNWASRAAHDAIRRTPPSVLKECVAAYAPSNHHAANTGYNDSAYGDIIRASDGFGYPKLKEVCGNSSGLIRDINLLSRREIDTLFSLRGSALTIMFVMRHLKNALFSLHQIESCGLRVDINPNKIDGCESEFPNGLQVGPVAITYDPITKTLKFTNNIDHQTGNAYGSFQND
jgi:hypothetical protein